MPTAPLRQPDIEAIERATVATVSPEATEEFADWLIAFDRGTIGRAKCAVPLRHGEYSIDDIAAIEARYAVRGLPPMFRLADDPCFASLHAALRDAGYRDDRQSLVQVAATRDVRALVVEPAVAIAAMPDDAWGRVFLGEGFDPVDGANRVRALTRAPDAVYACVRADHAMVAEGSSQNADAIAAGAASFGYGWASIHAMRTALAHRGEGLAGRILSALAQVALDRGFDRMFLQVEENNAGAQSLYRRAGFTDAWRYAYWSR